MIEYRVDEYAETTRVAGVDEADQPVGAPVGFVHGVPEHAVVSPSVRSAERVDRHHLDEIDTEFHKVVQLVDRGVECATRGEGADVQLVDHPALDRASAPVADTAGIGRRMPQLRALVHAVRLSGRAGVGQDGGVVIEDEAVARVGLGLDDRVPPAVAGAGHRVQRAADVEAYLFGQRRPDCEFVLRHQCAPTE
jgi:hypothetical protein